MLNLVAGEQRAGKTLYVVRRVLTLHAATRPAAPIWTNIDIDHPKAVRLPWADLLDPELPAGFVIWDEAARAFDSRRSMSHTMSQLQGITEEGKSLRDVYLTAQDFGFLDVRVRRMCTRAVRIRGLFPTKDRFDPVTDELLRRRHPRLVSIEVGKWQFAEKPNKDNRLTRMILPWRCFKPYVTRYDTAEKVALAGHLAAGKDYYREERDARGGAAAASRGPRSAGAADAAPRADPTAPRPVPADVPVLAPRGVARHAR